VQELSVADAQMSWPAMTNPNTEKPRLRTARDLVGLPFTIFLQRGILPDARPLLRTVFLEIRQSGFVESAIGQTRLAQEN